ncbi:helix-turn-helix domain-containing protein [Clostridium akagii]|uniref:helix-turn-helix domain-containing protein n=1 Tax=Clostridium akagii TaxID=91623 RepID=UPI00047D39CE|nr:helix-turn-helix transcriptional regulator [Clostridium akagii]
MTRVGEKIKLLREQNGMTQKALAKKLGVSESFINEIELGRKVASDGVISRISKIFGKELDDVNMYTEEDSKDQDQKEKDQPFIRTKPIKSGEVNQVWNDALSSILKSVPVYKMDLKSVVSTRQLPLVSNKIDGFAQDKVFFIEIENDDMLGFRISKGDIAFAHTIHEVENNAICIINYNNENIIRQIKRIDNAKLLLISNASSVKTETVNVKNIKMIAKLDRVEIKL